MRHVLYGAQQSNSGGAAADALQIGRLASARILITGERRDGAVGTGRCVTAEQGGAEAADRRDRPPDPPPPVPLPRPPAGNVRDRSPGTVQLRMYLACRRTSDRLCGFGSIIR